MNHWSMIPQHMWITALEKRHPHLPQTPWLDLSERLCLNQCSGTRCCCHPCWETWLLSPLDISPWTRPVSCGEELHLKTVEGPLHSVSQRPGPGSHQQPLELAGVLAPGWPKLQTPSQSSWDGFSSLNRRCCWSYCTMSFAITFLENTSDKLRTCGKTSSEKTWQNCV